MAQRRRRETGNSSRRTKDEAQTIFANYIEMMRRLKANDLAREEFWKLVPDLKYDDQKAGG